MTSRKAAQTAALVALLQSQPDDVLSDVLGALGTKGVVVLETPLARPSRPCGVCGKSYPQCRRLWADDHDYEAPSDDQPRPCGFHAWDDNGRCVTCGKADK